MKFCCHAENFRTAADRCGFYDLLWPFRMHFIFVRKLPRMKYRKIKCIWKILDLHRPQGTMINFFVSRPPRALIFSARRKKKNTHCLNRGVRGDRFPSRADREDYAPPSPFKASVVAGGCFIFTPTWLIIRDACGHVLRMLQLASARKIDRTVMAGKAAIPCRSASSVEDCTSRSLQQIHSSKVASARKINRNSTTWSPLSFFCTFISAKAYGLLGFPVMRPRPVGFP